MSDAEKPGGGSSLGHLSEGKWEFDESVTRVFTDMLRRSIPQYELMRQTAYDIARLYVSPGSDIVDLGCSRGDALAPFLREFGSNCQYLGLEVSAPMLQAARERFQPEIDDGFLRIENRDLRDAYPDVQASVTLCVLTLQFTPLEHRQRILDEVYRHTIEGGILILVEKVHGASEAIDRQMVELYHRFKSMQGYSAEEVERKALALEGVLMPQTASQNEQMISTAGFSQVDSFWRWMNFAGWIAIR